MSFSAMKEPAHKVLHPFAQIPTYEVGDLVLLRLKASGLLDGYPNLSAYLARGETRPAFTRAFEAHLAVFTGRAIPTAQ